MQIDAAQTRHLQNRGTENQAVGRDDEEIAIQIAQLTANVIFAQSGWLENR